MKALHYFARGKFPHGFNINGENHWEWYFYSIGSCFFYDRLSIFSFLSLVKNIK